MFSCLWLHFKKCFEKYFLVFGCVLKNTIENTFSTCCSHFLTFLRLPNEYIISFISQYRNTNKTQEKKSSNPITFSHSFSVAKQILQYHSFLNTETQTKPRKKKSSNSVKLREEGRERSDWVRRGARSRSGGEGEIGAALREIAIGAKARSRSTARSFSLCAFARSFFLSLSLSACGLFFLSPSHSTLSLFSGK